MEYVEQNTNYSAKANSKIPYIVQTIEILLIQEVCINN